MNFGGLRIVAEPNIQDAVCKKCDNYCIIVDDGFVGNMLFCPKCEIVYELKLVKIQDKYINKEYLEQCKKQATKSS